MDKPSPFILYVVNDANGTFKHSSVLYDDRLVVGQTPSPDLVREMLLVSCSYAGNDFEWPEHGHIDNKDMTMSIYGPFFPGEPLSKVTTAEYHALDEDDLP